MSTFTSLDLTTTISQTEGLFSARIGDEVAMLHTERGRYYSLNATGSAIWRRLERPAQVAEICESLQHEFEVDRVTCEDETLEILRSLLAEGLITILPCQG